MERLGGKSKGAIDYAPFVPWWEMRRFRRFHQAGFDDAKAEKLGDMTYSEMIKRRWMEIAESKAIAKHS